jgi:hypothetical protein
VGAIVFALAAGEAVAAGLRPVDRGYNALTDGSRFVVYRIAYTLMRVRDTATGRRHDVAIDRTCFVPSASDGLLLLSCGSPARYRVMRLATRVVQDVVGTPGAFDTFDRVGRFWLGGQRCGGHCGPLYRNWRTGKQRYAEGARDLDSPALVRDDYRRHDRLVEGHNRDRLEFRPAGARTRWTQVSSCTSFCLDLHAAHGRAAWIEGRTVYGYIHHDRRACSWRVPATKAPGPEVLPTRYEMVVSSGATLYAAPWRHC